MSRWKVIAEQVSGGLGGLLAWQTVKDAPMSLEQARRAYDRGTHELAQRRLPDGRLLLLALERRTPAKRHPYFGHGHVARASSRPSMSREAAA